MDQKKRTKVLAGALAVVLGFGLIRPDQKIMAPITEAQKRYQAAEAKLEQAADQELLVMLAEVDVERAQAVSLPPSPTDALRVYQKWINNLAEQCNFAALKVSPGRIDNRANEYLTVNVQVEGEVGLEDFSRFMFLFDQANLVHRITALDIESTGSSGTPRMEVSLTAQGMSVAGAASHDDVFPLTTLMSEIAADQTELAVRSAEMFPKKTPFLAQVGYEMVEVTETVDNKWKVKRGVQGTKPAKHIADEYVQLFDVRYQDQPASFDEYKNFLASSPFVKPVVPRKLAPKIAGLSDKTIAPGESVSLQVSTVDVDADVGAVTFALENAADGMTLNEETGEFNWETTTETEAKTYSPSIVVLQKNNEDLKLTQAFNVTLRLPNDAPKLVVPSEAIVVLGQSFELGLSAEDDGDSSALSFSLEGNVPDGLTVDGSAKKLTWIPAKTFAPGEYDVTVKVTDGGEPAKSSSESVKLKVQDDTAVYLKLTGSVSLDGEPVALFRNLISANNPKLKVGEKIEASEISATVKEIANRFILIEDAEGVWRVDLGATLRDRKLIEPAPKPEEPVTTEGSSVKQDTEGTAVTEKVATDKTAAEETAPGDNKTTESGVVDPSKDSQKATASDVAAEKKIPAESNEAASTEKVKSDEDANGENPVDAAAVKPAVTSAVDE